MENNENKYYTPADISKRIDLSTSSIRRYTLALENKGYTGIVRDTKGNRRYTLADVRSIEYMYALINNKNLKFDDAVEKTINDRKYIDSDVDKDVLNGLSDEQAFAETDIEQLNTKLNAMYELLKTVQEQNARIVEQNDLLISDNKRLSELIDKQALLLENKGVDASLDAKINDDKDVIISDLQTVKEDVKESVNVDSAQIEDKEVKITISAPVSAEKVEEIKAKDIAIEKKEEQRAASEEHNTKKGFFARFFSL